jgi:hypothetical protein
MINPIRRLCYEVFVLPIVNSARKVIDLTTTAFRLLPIQSRQTRQRKPYLLRWQNDVPRTQRST